MSNFGSKITSNYFSLLLLIFAFCLNGIAFAKVGEKCDLKVYMQNVWNSESVKMLTDVKAQLLSDKSDCTVNLRESVK
jgi:hypothetical protein